MAINAQEEISYLRTDLMEYHDELMRKLDQIIDLLKLINMQTK